MKKSTRWICAILSVVTLLSAFPVMALDSESVSVSMTELRDQMYTEHVVPLPDISTINETARSSVDDRLDRILAAEEYVENMDIPEDLKAECLAELQSYRQDEDCYLLEYSVYVPKTRSGEAYFGTYRNVDFYMKWVSRSTTLAEKVTTDEERLLKSWQNLLTELGVYLVEEAYPESDKVLAAWSVFEPLLESNYVFYEGDYVEQCASLSTEYVKTYVSNDGTYEAVHGFEYGDVDPYLVYHTAKDYGGLHTHEEDLDRIEYDIPATQYILANSYAGYVDGYFDSRMRDCLQWIWE